MEESLAKRQGKKKGRWQDGRAEEDVRTPIIWTRGDQNHRRVVGRGERGCGRSQRLVVFATTTPASIRFAVLFGTQLIQPST
jgi:hypothetical protein